MALGKGINTKAFSKNNLMASVNASATAHKRQNAQLGEIAQIYEDLRKDFANAYVPGNIQKEILTEAAQIGVMVTRLEAPVADKEVDYYNTAKITKKTRAPKGSGKIKKTIRPGTLAKNIQVYTHGRFKKLHSIVFYGPKYPQVAYAHLPHFGSKYINKVTPYMKTGFEKAKGRMMDYIRRSYKEELLKVWEESLKRQPKK